MDYYSRGRSPSPGRSSEYYGRNTSERRHKIDPWGRDDEVSNGSANREGRETRSRDAGRDRRRSRTRSRSHERYSRRSPGRDLYKEMIDKDYEDNRYSRERYRSSRRDRSRDRDRYRSPSPHRRRRRSRSDSEDSYDYQNDDNPNNKIIVRGLASHLTEADISSDLINCGLKPVSVRLIRKSKTGASRGFAFVEFETVEQARHWMTSRQGCLLLQDHYKASIHYSFQKQKSEPEDLTDWYCGKCGVFNFKRRGTCFKCSASRETSSGEGSDECSNSITKKIILRNLDVLTNEERILTAMQELIPSLVSKISQILICRDPLTQTSRGICYMNFENLVDSMNTYNALKALEPPLKIDNRQVMINYCTDGEKQKRESKAGSSSEANVDDYQYQYTLSDVQRLAEYSAGLYATNTTEHSYYIKYYTDYYTSQITSGQLVNFPTQAQLGEANNGAAVALSAIQRKMGKSEREPVPVAKKAVEIPKGNDGKKYPAPNPSLYDETSGYYFDANTGLYYDAMSHYYYNNETGAFLYWDQENSTYIQANTAFGTQPKPEEKKEEEVKKKKEDKPQDKVKVAKKIVKDMEKWAKQLNQKKEMVVAPPPPSISREEPKPQIRAKDGYADVGFSILEKKDRNPNLMGIMAAGSSKLVSYGQGSDSDEQQEERPRTTTVSNEKDYIDFAKLTCNVCKRAFPSPEVLQKHLSMSQLHKDNLQKYNLTRGILDIDKIGSAGYRDRAKERRQKYGEADPPPVNRIRERYEREMERQQAVIQPTLAATPIGENNVGNKLLQKMGWTEGQGLGRSNQGRTDIIEAAQRVPSAGLGAETSKYAGSGDDYKTYIKRMMKTRYEQVGP